MKHFPNYLATELRLRFRIPISVFFIFVFPIFLMVAFASSFGHADPNYVKENIANIMFYGVLSASVTSFSSDISRYKSDNFYFLLERRAGNKFAYMLAQVVAFILIIFASTLVVLGIAHACYHYALPNFATLALFYGKLFLYTLPWFLVAIIIGFSAKNSAVASAIAMPVMFVSYFLAGMMVPYQMLTGTLKRISQHFFLTQMLSDLTHTLGQVNFLPMNALWVSLSLSLLLILAILVLYRNVLVRR